MPPGCPTPGPPTEWHAEHVSRPAMTCGTLGAPAGGVSVAVGAVVAVGVGVAVAPTVAVGVAIGCAVGVAVATGVAVEVGRGAGVGVALAHETAATSIPTTARMSRVLGILTVIFVCPFI